MRSRLNILVIASVVLVPTLMASTASAQTREAGAQDYAAALAVAFNAYQSEVEAAFGATYASEAEADAVSRSLGVVRFNGLLDLALSSRGLSRQGFANYLASHHEFARAQRVMHHGRLARLTEMATTLNRHVSGTGSLVAFHQAPLRATH